MKMENFISTINEKKKLADLIHNMIANILKWHNNVFDLLALTLILHKYHLLGTFKLHKVVTFQIMSRP